MTTMSTTLLYCLYHSCDECYLPASYEQTLLLVLAFLFTCYYCWLFLLIVVVVVGCCCCCVIVMVTPEKKSLCDTSVLLHVFTMIGVTVIGVVIAGVVITTEMATMQQLH